MGTRARGKSARRKLPAACVIFDADDTLWDTQPLYEDSKGRFFSLMEKCGFPSTEVSPAFEMRDHANVAKYAFSKHRFPQSMRDTYIAFCASYGRRVNAKIANRALKIGQTVFQRTPTIIAGVEKALDSLARNQVKLLLATKGDKEIQSLRVQKSGLRPYFDRIYLLQEKGIQDFKRIISKENISHPQGWSVGNSAKSDINPALAAGLNAVWVRRDTWMYESAEVVESSRLHIVRSIDEVPAIVLRGKA
jgi:putative hydrolase of the HAD superfamily